MSRRAVWITVFLGFFTGGALVMECWASWDGNPDTVPWTDLIVGYVPWEIAAAVIGALALWLPLHLGWRYWKRRKPPVD